MLEGHFKTSTHPFATGPDLTTSICMLLRTLDALEVQNLGQCGFNLKYCGAMPRKQNKQIIQILR